MRRQFTPSQKAAVAFATLKGDKTINQIAAENEVHPTQVKQWRDAAKAIVPEAFADGRKTAAKTADGQKQIDELHRVIGVRDAELEWYLARLSCSGCLAAATTTSRQTTRKPGFCLSVTWMPWTLYTPTTRSMAAGGCNWS